MIQTVREYLAETKASDTLKNAPKTKPTTTNAARALEIMMRLSPSDQRKHLDWLEKSLKNDDNGAGVPDDYAEKTEQISEPILTKTKTACRT